MLICVGLQDGRRAASSRDQPGNIGGVGSEDPLSHRVAMADLLTLARVTSYAGERHSRYRILDPASTSFSDLQNEPT